MTTTCFGLSLRSQSSNRLSVPLLHHPGLHMNAPEPQAVDQRRRNMNTFDRHHMPNCGEAVQTDYRLLSDAEGRRLGARGATSFELLRWPMEADG